MKLLLQYIKGTGCPNRRGDRTSTARWAPVLLSLLLSPVALLAVEPCRIEVVEKGSGWPVPLVELRTTHNVRFVTDNAGVSIFGPTEVPGGMWIVHALDPQQALFAMVGPKKK
jgi:hypothetical protein